MAVLSNSRIDLRISSKQKELIKYASELRGFKNVSEFVIFCASSEASKIVSESNDVLSTLEDKKLFIEAILNPPKPNKYLKEAQINYNNLLEQYGGIPDNNIK